MELIYNRESEWARIQELTDAWSDCHGLISGNHHDECDNGIRFTASWFLALNRKALVNPLVFIGKITTVYWQCVAKDKDGRPIHGLLNRSPRRKHQQGIDDYISLATALWRAKSTLSSSFYAYGLSNGWVYNNERPGMLYGADNKLNLKAWFIRFPAVICHFSWCANVTPNLFLRLYWVGSILRTAYFAKRNAQDDWLLNRDMIEAMNGRCKLSTWAAKKWESRFIKMFGSLKFGTVWSEYFNNPEHPLGEYA